MIQVVSSSKKTQPKASLEINNEMVDIVGNSLEENKMSKMDILGEAIRSINLDLNRKKSILDITSSDNLIDEKSIEYRLIDSNINKEKVNWIDDLDPMISNISEYFIRICVKEDNDNLYRCISKKLYNDEDNISDLKKSIKCSLETNKEIYENFLKKNKDLYNKLELDDRIILEILTLSIYTKTNILIYKPSIDKFINIYSNDKFINTVYLVMLTNKIFNLLDKDGLYSNYLNIISLKECIYKQLFDKINLPKISFEKKAKSTNENKQSPNNKDIITSKKNKLVSQKHAKNIMASTENDSTSKSSTKKESKSNKPTNKSPNVDNMPSKTKNDTKRLETKQSGTHSDEEDSKIIHETFKGLKIGSASQQKFLGLGQIETDKTKSNTVNLHKEEKTKKNKPKIFKVPTTKIDEGVKMTKNDEGLKITKNDEVVKTTKDDEVVKTTKNDEDVKITIDYEGVKPTKDEVVKTTTNDEDVKITINYEGVKTTKDEVVKTTKNDEDVKITINYEGVKTTKNDEGVKRTKFGNIKSTERFNKKKILHQREKKIIFSPSTNIDSTSTTKTQENVKSVKSTIDNYKKNKSKKNYSNLKPIIHTSPLKIHSTTIFPSTIKNDDTSTEVHGSLAKPVPAYNKIPIISASSSDRNCNIIESESNYESSNIGIQKSIKCDKTPMSQVSPNRKNKMKKNYNKNKHTKKTDIKKNDKSAVEETNQPEKLPPSNVDDDKKPIIVTSQKYEENLNVKPKPYIRVTNVDLNNNQKSNINVKTVEGCDRYQPRKYTDDELNIPDLDKSKSLLNEIELPKIDNNRLMPMYKCEYDEESVAEDKPQNITINYESTIKVNPTKKMSKKNKQKKILPLFNNPTTVSHWFTRNLSSPKSPDSTVSTDTKVIETNTKSTETKIETEKPKLNEENKNSNTTVEDHNININTYNRPRTRYYSRQYNNNYDQNTATYLDTQYNYGYYENQPDDYNTPYAYYPIISYQGGLYYPVPYYVYPNYDPNSGDYYQGTQNYYPNTQNIYESNDQSTPVIERRIIQDNTTEQSNTNNLQTDQVNVKIDSSQAVTDTKQDNASEQNTKSDV